MSEQTEKQQAIALLEKQLSRIASAMKPMHLAMAKALVEGKTQEQAYKDAGGKAKDPRASASKLIATNRNIQDYVDLGKEIISLRSQEAAFATVEQKKRMLWGIAQKSSDLRVELNTGPGQFEPLHEDDDAYGVKPVIFDATSAKTAISAIAELNKMDGDYAAVEVHNRDLTVEGLIAELTEGDD